MFNIFKKQAKEPADDIIAAVTFQFSTSGRTEVLLHIRDPQDTEDLEDFKDLLLWIIDPKTSVQTLGVVAEILDGEGLESLKESIFIQAVASNLVDVATQDEQDEQDKEADEDDPCIKPSDVV